MYLSGNKEESKYEIQKTRSDDDIADFYSSGKQVERA